MTSCAICSKTIKESTSKSKGEDAVFCEGFCQSWMHRQCIGMSIPILRGLTMSQAPFYCIYCSQNKITELKNRIETLETQLVSLQPVNPLPSFATSNSPTSYSDIAQSNLPVKQPRNITLADQTSRKFNVVVYSIKEKPKGSLKHTRLIQDTDDVSEVFKKLDSSISAQSIRDCTRLGKYTDNKCRPVLVKLSRSFEISSLLSQRKKLKDTPGVSIKPDMSPDERKVDLVLMSKR